MKMYDVDSSNIKAIGYENGNVIVAFKNGTQYAYENVDEKLFKCFLDSDSKGKFFAQHIKGKFEYKQLGLEKYLVKAYQILDSRLFGVDASSSKQAIARAKKEFKEEVSEDTSNIVFVVVEED